MNEKFKILTNFIKDMSCETPDVESYLFVKENISKYHLNIVNNVNSLVVINVNNVSSVRCLLYMSNT